MTREHAKELLPILAAYANGEEIQVEAGCGQWVPMDHATLNFEGNPSGYRIKPKPREWFVFRDNGGYWEIQSEAPSAIWDEIIKVREILD